MQEYEKKTFQESIQFLSEKYRIPLPQDFSYNSKLPNSREILQCAEKFYKSHVNKILSYLIDTRELKTETIDIRNLGYGTEGFDLLLKHLLNQGFKL